MSESYVIVEDERCLCGACVLRRAVELARALKRKFSPDASWPGASVAEPPVGNENNKVWHARRQLIGGLRAVADYYERNPGAYYDGMTVFLNMYAGERCAAQALGCMADGLGEWKDLSDGKYVSIGRNFGEKVRLQFFARRGKAAGSSLNSPGGQVSIAGTRSERPLLD
jgi:hypothetical protein